jgi:hypothetical protein
MFTRICQNGLALGIEDVRLPSYILHEETVEVTVPTSARELKVDDTFPLQKIDAFRIYQEKCYFDNTPHIGGLVQPNR